MMDGGIDMTSDISTSLIVVGVDGSAGSREALLWAVAYAELSGAAVRPVMAWQLPEVYSMVSQDYEADARLELQTAIEETLAPDQRSHVTSLVTPGRPGHVLVDASRHGQLLVVGSHGHGELIGKFVDSVSAQLRVPRRMPGSGRPALCVVVLGTHACAILTGLILRSDGRREGAVTRSLSGQTDSGSFGRRRTAISSHTTTAIARFQNTAAPPTVMAMAQERLPRRSRSSRMWVIPATANSAARTDRGNADNTSASPAPAPTARTNRASPMRNGARQVRAPKA